MMVIGSFDSFIESYLPRPLLAPVRITMEEGAMWDFGGARGEDGGFWDDIVGD